MDLCEEEEAVRVSNPSIKAENMVRNLGKVVAMWEKKRAVYY